MNGLQIGFITDCTRDEVERMESLAIDSLWTGGHVAAPRPQPEAMNRLCQLAAVSRRVRIGSSILLLPLYPPAIVAKQIADIDLVTGGRVTLGIGVGGEYPEDFRACGVPINERGARTNEAIPLIRRLWTAEEVTHEGRFFPMEKVKIHPAPAQPKGPPIVISGRKPPAWARAAKLGDGWMPYLYSPRAYTESVQAIRQMAADNGRDLSGFEWMEFLFINVNDDREKARAETAAYLGATYGQDFNELVDRLTASGTVEQVAGRVQAFLDAGARHFIFAVTAKDRVAMAGRIIDEVLPRVVAPA